MARGDSISLNSASTSANVFFTMRPSSGDEWMITGLGASTTTQYMIMVSSSGGTQYMYFRDQYSSSVTTTTEFMKSTIPDNPIKWFVSNSVYIKTTSGWGYLFYMMGIKTKE